MKAIKKYCFRLIHILLLYMDMASATAFINDNLNNVFIIESKEGKTFNLIKTAVNEIKTK